MKFGYALRMDLGDESFANVTEVSLKLWTDIHVTAGEHSVHNPLVELSSLVLHAALVWKAYIRFPRPKIAQNKKS